MEGSDRHLLKVVKFNIEIAPNRTSLMAMEKTNQEFVRTYVQRWRDKATHVQPLLIKTEMVMLFATPSNPLIMSI